MIVDLAAMKAHLNVTFNDDDALITAKIAAAQSYVEAFVGFRLDEETFPDTDDDDFPDTVPAALVEAVMQLAAHRYENREAVLVGVNGQGLPLGLEDTLAQFRNYSFGAADE